MLPENTRNLFEELNHLSYKDLVSVCHGIFAIWGGHSEIVEHLKKDHSKIAIEFAKKYSHPQNRALLLSYINERATYSVSPSSRKAGEAFLQKIKPTT